jgi:RNA polymerase sigma-70 factor (ECF subfamily)
VTPNNAHRGTQPLPDEARLVQLARAGDADAFAQLYDAYVERVYRYVYFRVTDNETAEDLTSQVFLKAWENLGRYRPGGPFLAWLYTIAHNTVIDHYRTRKSTVPLEEVASLVVQKDDLDDHLELQSNIETLRTALQHLTPDQQQVLMMRFIAEMSTEEVARAMGKREGAVRALQMRALHTLEKYMEKEKIL